MNPEVSSRSPQKATRDPILIQLNPGHTSAAFFPKTHYVKLSYLHLEFHKLHFTMTLLNQNVCILVLTIRAVSPANLKLLDLIALMYIRGTVQTVEMLIMNGS
jgi:hypothetical protein